MAANIGPAGDLLDHIMGTIYGNCIGDAIGLLTEFFTKETAQETYGEYENLEHEHKVQDMHRRRWKKGDWTDDTDQMILIMLSLLDKDGQVDPVDFGQRLAQWARRGFPELGDLVGMGIGSTTAHVLKHECFQKDPHGAAADIWDETGRVVAPNGGIMRTSILGVYQFDNIDQVTQNTVSICKTTHADPRCQASCVAVTTAIAHLLQRKPHHLLPDGSYDVNKIMKDSYKHSKGFLGKKNYRKYKNEMKSYIFCKNLSDLKLDDKDAIGYTFKAMGAGFWALRQTDFRTAIQQLTMEGGDADSNGSVAGAMLGCKLGASRLPDSWLSGLCHKDWLDQLVERFLKLVPQTQQN